MHPALEIAVAGKHRTHGNVVFLDGRLDRLGQRSAVSNAGGATIGRDVEAEGFQGLKQPGFLEVFRRHLRAGSQRGLDVGRDFQPLFNRLFGDKACAHDKARIGGVGAAGDRGNHDRAILQGSKAWNFDLFFRRLEVVVELLLELAERQALMRLVRAGNHRHDGGEVEFECRGVVGFVGKAPEPLFFAVGFDQLALLVGAAGFTKIGDGLFINGEEAHRCTILGSHVGDGTAISQRKAGRTFTMEFDELADHAEFAQHFSDG